ncbi:MAG: hypothetical protein JETT_2256 [Candidatus Jettenia ecosi]|uniref:Uncharacterized protein n=1 Tax=Candidatus Jettenia ecosi TaxID=2494326 RepID=A0A533QLL0_9BACT|nr:MAG: hypothetical protein JETT_2256 [Candidatus Jettenia ecosi]
MTFCNWPFVFRKRNMQGKKISKTRKEKKVSDMTVGELKKLIKDTVLEAIDPDYGLELRPEVEFKLEESLKRKAKGIPLETVVKELGLE